MTVLAVVGAQFGSEGKGVIVNHLADQYDIHVRTGGPNAGHSFKHNGRTWKQQCVPCGWTNPAATLVIGRGAVVDLGRVELECEAIAEHGGDPDIYDRLVIDPDAWVVTPEDRQHEGHRHMRDNIGSTTEGVGSARCARIWRDPSLDRRVRTVLRGKHPYRVEDTVRILHDMRMAGRPILLEGTQGTGLSLYHGQWPYCTSADTTAAALASAAGIPPQHVQCLLVARTFPIRVAGNSGPLHRELSWDILQARLGKDVTERTTVTNLVRRIGVWDRRLFHRSVMLNGPSAIALTFADYVDPACEGETDPSKLTEPVLEFIKDVEEQAARGVWLVGTGGPEWSVIERTIS